MTAAGSAHQLLQAGRHHIRWSDRPWHTSCVLAMPTSDRAHLVDAELWQEEWRQRVYANGLSSNRTECSPEGDLWAFDRFLFLSPKNILTIGDLGLDSSRFRIDTGLRFVLDAVIGLVAAGVNLRKTRFFFVDRWMPCTKH